MKAHDLDHENQEKVKPGDDYKLIEAVLYVYCILLMS